MVITAMALLFVFSDRLGETLYRYILMQQL